VAVPRRGKKPKEDGVIILTSMFFDEPEIQQRNGFLKAVVRKDPET
jgi:hypothetical protein